MIMALNGLIFIFYILLQIKHIEPGFAHENINQFMKHKRSSINGEYIGCFALGCFELHYNISLLENFGTTPDSCSARCHDEGFTFAYVFQASECSCSCGEACLESPLDDWKCGLPCIEDPQKFCGGLNFSSVYRVRYLHDPCTNITVEAEPPDNGTGGIKIAILVSILVVACSIIGVLIIVVVTFYRRLSKWTSSARVRANSIRQYSRRISRRFMDRDDVTMSDDQHGAASNSALSVRPRLAASYPPEYQKEAPQMPVLDAVNIDPYEVSLGIGQELLYTHHYSTLERGQVGTLDDEQGNAEYDFPYPPSLLTRQTIGFKSGKDGYLVPGSALDGTKF